MNRNLPLIPLAGIAAAVLILPGTASAKDVCVGNPAGCSGTAVPASALESTLKAAETDGADDRIFLGAGTFDVKPLSYGSLEKLELIGAGAGQTRLRSSGQAPVLTLGGNAGSTVSRLTIEPAGQATSGLNLIGTRAEDVDVSVSAMPNLTAGVQLIGGASFARGSVKGTAGSTSALLVRSGAPTISDSTVVATGLGIVSGGSDTTVRGVHVQAQLGALAQLGHLTITDSLIDTRGSTNQVGVVAIAEGIAKGAAPIVDAARLTVIGSIPDGTSGGGAGAAADGADQRATLRLRDSVITGYGAPVIRQAQNGGVADVTTDRSAYGNSSFPETGDGKLTENDRLSVSPRFVDAGKGDFHLAADSPLIDAGTPGSVGDDAVDLDGRPRVSDGNADCARVNDIGAFELQGSSPSSCTPAPSEPQPSPAPPQGGGRLPAPPAEIVAPKLTKLSVTASQGSRRRVSSIAFKLSAPAKVEIRFARVGKKGKVTKLKTKVTVKGKAGLNRVRATLAPGAYKVTAVAIVAGVKSKPATKAFKVRP
jgi:hypothetical protein